MSDKDVLDLSKNMLHNISMNKHERTEINGKQEEE